MGFVYHMLCFFCYFDASLILFKNYNFVCMSAILRAPGDIFVRRSVRWEQDDGMVHSQGGPRAWCATVFQSIRLRQLRPFRVLVVCTKNGCYEVKGYASEEQLGQAFEELSITIWRWDSLKCIGRCRISSRRSMLRCFELLPLSIARMQMPLLR